MGQAARDLKNHNIIVYRITGLDPAQPCFEQKSSSLRLKKNDASFTDVIHTNSEPGENHNFGIYDPIGKENVNIFRHREH